MYYPFKAFKATENGKLTKTRKFIVTQLPFGEVQGKQGQRLKAAEYERSKRKVWGSGGKP